MNAQRLYLWQAYDNDQNMQQGETAGESADKVRFQLILQGLAPIRIKSGPTLSSAHWPLSSLMIVTRQLATMLRAGLPLINCLQLLAKGHPKPQWRYLLNQIQQQVAQGKPFSQVLGQYPNVFPALFCELMQTGELTGELDLCCLKLAEQQEKSLNLQKKIKKALRYPVFILVITVLVTLLMLIFVLPEFAAIYDGFDAPLPYFTQLIMSLSDLIRSYGIGSAAMASTIVLIYMKRYRPKPVWQRREQQLALKIPLVNKLLGISYLARIFHTLSMTQRAGITLSEGLSAAANSANHYLYQQAILLIKRKIEEGGSFYQAVTECEFFSDLSRQLIQVGEESGSLDIMLAKLADIYEQEAASTAESLTQTLEPLLMLILGLIVGSLVIAMYLPIFQLGNVMG